MSREKKPSAVRPAGHVENAVEIMMRSIAFAFEVNWKSG
jgi:hypothetical protein|tara:strand:+ start:1017 stop:1133 length:117 start_codon:yes stop_codon:yes gene_type:complete